MNPLEASTQACHPTSLFLLTPSVLSSHTLSTDWKDLQGASLVVQWLRPCTSNPEGMISIHGWGTKIWQATDAARKEKGKFL